MFGIKIYLIPTSRDFRDFNTLLKTFSNPNKEFLLNGLIEKEESYIDLDTYNNTDNYDYGLKLNITQGGIMSYNGIYTNVLGGTMATDFPDTIATNNNIIIRTIPTTISILVPEFELAEPATWVNISLFT